MVKGVDGGYRYFIPLQVSLFLENMKIWCKIQVTIYLIRFADILWPPGLCVIYKIIILTYNLSERQTTIFVK